ncbi:MAG: GNAT family N-acetyltransferase [Turicibacter sp.]
MNIHLAKADNQDVEVILSVQIKSFRVLYEKYQDDLTSPAKETVEYILSRMEQTTTTYYKIMADERMIGAIRIRELSEVRYQIAPIFIHPDYQGKGIAQIVMHKIEKMYPDGQVWEVDTILQEPGLCYLYEKIGYKKTGKTRVVNEKMTLVSYEKKC